MAITNETLARDGLSNAFDVLVNTGSGTSTMIFRDDTTNIVTFNLEDPAFGASSTGTITLSGLPITAAAVAGGTIDGFQILDQDAALLLSGSITGIAGGGDIEVTNTTVLNLQTLTITSFTYSTPS